MAHRVSFWGRQVQDVRALGLHAVARKAGTALRHGPRWLAQVVRDLPAYALLGAIWCLRPWRTVKMGVLRPARMGHFAPETEIYVSECDAGVHGPDVINAFFYDRNLVPVEGTKVCNVQLKVMWERSVRVWPVARRAAELCRPWPGWEKHHVPWRMHHPRDIHGALVRTGPHLRFTRREEARGRAMLRELGVPEGAPFVCFHCRDSAYLNAYLAGYKSDYHDYRDCYILNYVPAMQAVTERGYYAIRMGKIVKDKLPALGPRIVDYATTAQNDFMDIYLGARCAFFVGTGTGADAIPMVFRRPIAYTNILPVGMVHSWESRHISILKRLYLRGHGRLMTYPEIMASPVGMAARSEIYDEAGVDLLENTPDEITAITLEMEERLRGAWVAAPQDEALQAKFWSLMPRGEFHGEIRSRIGTAFLRAHPELLARGADVGAKP